MKAGSGIVAVLVASALLVGAATAARPAWAESRLRLALDAQKSYVHCFNSRVSTEQWDEEQMRVRHGSNVCQLRSFTSSSSAQSWARSNFPSGRCSC